MILQENGAREMCVHALFLCESVIFFEPSIAARSGVTFSFFFHSVEEIFSFYISECLNSVQ